MGQADIHKEGDVLDFTAVGAKLGGDVVVTESGLAGVLVNDVAALATGSATVKAIVKAAKVTGAITAGDEVGWDNNGSPVGGVALSGAATTVKASWDFALGVATVDAASGDARVQTKLNASALGVTTLENVVVDPGDAGAIAVNESGSVSLVSAGAETRTLADPTYVGQQLSLGFKTDGGDCVVTSASPINQTGNNTMTFADVGDHLQLTAIEDGADIEWRVDANDGVALTTV